MKKLLLLMFIGLSVLSITKVQAQTVNWAKGFFDNESYPKLPWAYLSSNKKYFYTSSNRSTYQYLSIFSTESGNLLKKFDFKSGNNHYLVNDSTFLYFDYVENDSSNICYCYYDNVNMAAENSDPIYSAPVEFNNKRIDFVEDNYKDFINEDYLIALGKCENQSAFIFWNIKKKCIHDVVYLVEGDFSSIKSITYDQKNNMLYYSDQFCLFQYNVSSKKVVKKDSIIGVSGLVLSSDGKYLAFRYFNGNAIEERIVLIDLSSWEIEYQKESYYNIYFVTPTAISPNSTVLAYQTADNQLEIYNINTKKTTKYTTLFRPDYIHFVNDQELVFASEKEGFTAIFDIEKNMQTKTLINNESIMRAIKYSHNGELIAVLGSNYLKVLDAKTGNMINCFYLNYGYNVYSKYFGIDFSKDGEKIIFTRDIDGYIICDLKTNKTKFNKASSSVITGCYSNLASDIIAYGTADGNVIISNTNDGNIIKKQSYNGYIIRHVMFAENGNSLYFTTINPDTYENNTYIWDYESEKISKIDGLDYGFIDKSTNFAMETFFDRFLCSRYLAYDVKSQKQFKLDYSHLPDNFTNSNFSVSYDGSYSNLVQFSNDLGLTSLYCNFYKNETQMAENIIKSIYSTDYIPYNSYKIYGYSAGKPYISLFSPDNKNLILGLDCGSIISLNIENLTPVKDDVKLSDGFRIVNVENKDTYLNCEISSANEFDSFDYYIYDLNGKLLNQGALGTVDQGVNTITINYTKKMLYPAILLVKSRVNNTYQSKLFY
ncbi:MAG: hypothetical protein WCR42_09645 [bacterium]